MKTSPGIILANLAVAATILTFSACATKSTTGKTESANTAQPAPATAAAEPAQPGAAARNRLQSHPPPPRTTKHRVPTGNPKPTRNGSPKQGDAEGRQGGQ